MFVCLFLSECIHQYLRFLVWLSGCLSLAVYQSGCICLSDSLCLSVCLPVSLSACLTFYTSLIGFFIILSLFLTICFCPFASVPKYMLYIICQSHCLHCISVFLSIYFSIYLCISCGHVQLSHWYNYVIGLHVVQFGNNWIKKNLSY